MTDKIDAIRSIAKSMAVSDSLEYVVQMPGNRRIKNPYFETHVDNRMKEAERLYNAVRAMKSRRAR